MNIVLIGSQGCGKGTQAEMLARETGMIHISTGDLLRHARGSLKKEIHSYIDKGNLVPDELIIKLIKIKLKETKSKKGVILDGFPRDILQAEQLNKITKIDAIIEIYISDKEAIRRIMNRWNCPKCGLTYNLISNPPKSKGICNKCQTKLVQREDDKEDAIKKRLFIYHKETEPILKMFKLYRVNGELDINKVHKEITGIVKGMSRVILIL
ncbi:adenylate kinase [Candidatus Pacearchaeota archaeon CG10_big_fil_rev_8_21_14_0_10_32_14]|nr:MAG: adenylate kinase [Candidatus Pacearchaeota archaeon CG10_big_fil_rev_8_21_14_0_10_32_14]